MTDIKALESPLPDGERTQRSVRLILNPTSGTNSTVEALPAIVSALEGANLRVVLSFTSADTPPTALAEQAVQDGFDLVVVAGGDGTVSAVAKGLLHSNVPLGILPVGTYNNIARSLGIPNTAEEALKVVLAGQERQIDVGSANGAIFLEVAGVGLDAQLFPVAEQIKEGAWFQLQAALRTLVRFRPRRLRIELEDGRQIMPRPLLATVSNLPYFGANYAIAPEARPDSGQLVLSIFENFTKFQLLSYFASLANGNPVDEPRITTYHGTRFKISTVRRPDQNVHVDGQVVQHTPVTFEVQPKALCVVVPNN